MPESDILYLPYKSRIEIIKFTDMAENKDVKSKRDSLRERIQNKYPDEDFSDDEVLSGRISDDYDYFDAELAKRDEELDRYHKWEQDFLNMYNKDGRSAAFLTAWHNGADPFVELVKQYGPDVLLDSPEMSAATKEYAERIAEEKGFEEQYAKNMEESATMIDGMIANGEITEEQSDAALAFLLTIAKDGMLGKFSKENILMANKAINHDADVDEAAMEAEVRGKNAKINEKLRKFDSGDGTANLGGKNNTGAPAMENPDLAGALGRYGGNSTIWERGGEKRKARK